MEMRCAVTILRTCLAACALVGIRWLAKGDVVGQRQFIHTLFGIAV